MEVLDTNLLEILNIIKEKTGMEDTCKHFSNGTNIISYSGPDYEDITLYLDSNTFKELNDEVENIYNSYDMCAEFGYLKALREDRDTSIPKDKDLIHAIKQENKFINALHEELNKLIKEKPEIKNINYLTIQK